MYSSQKKTAIVCYRFIVGPYEQLGYIPDSPTSELSPKEYPVSTKSKGTAKKYTSPIKSKTSSSLMYRSVHVFCHIVQKLKNYLKSVTKCQYCAHPNGCLYYWLRVNL